MSDGSSRSRLVLGAAAGLLLLSLVTSGTLASTVQTQPEADNTVTRIHVFENGSAAWSVRIRTRLDSDEEVARYRAFQARFRNTSDAFLSAFRDRIRGTVSDAQNATGRAMNATEFAVSTDIQQLPRRWGVVTYEFVWTGFARQAGETLVVGDVFQGGLFLTPNDTLVIEPPPGYVVVAATPPPDSQEGDGLTWRGERNFDDGRPTVRFANPPSTYTLTPTATHTSSPPTRSSPEPATNSFRSGTPITRSSPANESRGAETGGTDSATPSPPTGASFPLVAVGLFGTFAVVVFFVLVRRSGSLPDPDVKETGSSTAPSSDSRGTGVPASGDSDEPESDPAAPPPTDAERVEGLLEANGGRMRQAKIADELGWSASKTSRILSGMADENRIEKLRLGRENVIDLSDRNQP